MSGYIPYSGFNQASSVAGCSFDSSQTLATTTQSFGDVPGKDSNSNAAAVNSTTASPEAYAPASQTNSNFMNFPGTAGSHPRIVTTTLPKSNQFNSNANMLPQNQSLPATMVATSQSCSTGTPPIPVGDYTARFPNISSTVSYPSSMPPTSFSSPQPLPQLPGAFQPTASVPSVNLPNLSSLSSRFPAPSPPCLPQQQSQLPVGTTTNTFSDNPGRQNFPLPVPPVPGISVPQPYGERFPLPNPSSSFSKGALSGNTYPSAGSSNLNGPSFPPFNPPQSRPLAPTDPSFVAPVQASIGKNIPGLTNGYASPRPDYGMQNVQSTYRQTGQANPAQPQPYCTSAGGYPPQMNALQREFGQMGFGNLQQPPFIDLTQEKDLFRFGVEEPKVELPLTVCNPEACCSPSIFRCTLKQIPQNEELLEKSRLPFGLTLHPFRDVKCISVIQASTIVRCRYCRTYINPYIYLIDNRHWKCNLCFRSNDFPDDFSWDPVTKSYGEPTRRPEIRNATVEFIAPSEYMLRPPQPAVYVFVMDVSHNAIESGYLYTFSEQLLLALEHMPGDDRTAVGFIAVDQSIHFFQFQNKGVPRQLIVDDIDDPFLPVVDGLLVNLKKNIEVVRTFVQNLPTLYEAGRSNNNCLGAAINIAHALIEDIGGRITVLQTVLPNIGPGALASREDPNKRASNDIHCLAPPTDFYKGIALECTGHQVAIDLFLLGTQYSDLSTLADMAKFSSGCVYHYPNYHMNRNLLQVKRFQKQLSRYLTRKIGFEAVLRIRCTRGLTLPCFYGNFFVRSTDLLVMANVNPDSAFSMQVKIEEDLNGLNNVCFQAALLYTSSKGDRRIRIHTLCLPVTKDLTTVYKYFDLRCSISLLSRMASDRLLSGRNLEDSREAMANAVIDAFSSFNNAVAQQGSVNAVLSPTTMMRLFPLSVLGMLKHTAFSFGRSTKLDDRAEYLLLFRTAPMEVTELEVLPTLYRLNDFYETDEAPQRLRLSFESVSADGVFLLDTGSYVYIYIGAKVQPSLLKDLFNCDNFSAIDEEENFDVLDNPLSKKVHDFLRTLQVNRSVYAPVVLIRENSPMKELFTSRLNEDRTESSYSYVEFIRHVCREMHR